MSKAAWMRSECILWIIRVSCRWTHPWSLPPLSTPPPHPHPAPWTPRMPQGGRGRVLSSAGSGRVERGEAGCPATRTVDCAGLRRGPLHPPTDWHYIHSISVILEISSTARSLLKEKTHQHHFKSGVLVVHLPFLLEMFWCQSKCLSRAFRSELYTEKSVWKQGQRRISTPTVCS